MQPDTALYPSGQGNRVKNQETPQEISAFVKKINDILIDESGIPCLYGLNQYSPKSAQNAPNKS